MSELNQYSDWYNGRVYALTDHTPPFSTNAEFFEYNGAVIWEKYTNPWELRRLYERCAPLSSLISTSAEAFASGKLEVLNAATDNYVRGKYKDWEDLLNNPNPLQGKNQYFQQQYTYTKVNGWSLALKLTPVGFNVPTKLFALPYWCLEVEDRGFITPYTMTREDLIKGIYFNYGGKRTLLDPDSLILFTDDTGDVDERTWLPVSRIKQQIYPITTELSSVEAELTMIQRKGALGILSNTDSDSMGKVALSPEEKQDLQAEFRSTYGLTRNQWQYIITNANLSWQSMTFPTKDLMLHESYYKAIKDLCFAYKFPYELTPYSDRKNLANVSTFDTILYQNKIMPEAETFAQQLMLGLNAKSNNIKIQFDYSHVPALQESDESMGKGLDAKYTAYQKAWDLGVMTRNQIMKAMGEDEMPGDEFNKYKWQLTEENTTNNAPEDQGTTA